MFLPILWSALFISVIAFCYLFVAAKWITKQESGTANVRTAQAARTGLPKAFRISFVGGAIMGIGIVAFALMGIVALFLGTWYYTFGTLCMTTVKAAQAAQALEILTSFALGAELIALFARVAGGIYTKAADVGADMVGKIEAGIPEDDPRNPATIADNVGDNVGDVAGMGADLFGSYVSTLLAAMVLGIGASSASSITTTILLPIAISALGLLVALIVLFPIRLQREQSSVQHVLNLANYAAIGLMALGGYVLLYAILQEKTTIGGITFTRQQLYYTLLLGLAVGLVVSWITEYFTSMEYAPVRFIIRQSITGSATNLIAGLSVGMFSIVMPMLVFAVAIYLAHYAAGFYGVAIAAVSMMSTTAIQLAIDAFGPIADNAGGIAEMSGLPKRVRQRTDALDAVGNTTAAAGKGFAIASAALTALGLLVAFVQTVGITRINLCSAATLAGCFVGAIVPFLFSGLVIRAVGKAAMEMVHEVRSQFRTIPGLLEGRALPNYDRCIAIATRAAIRQMFLPALLTLTTPVIIGFCFGSAVLGAFLISIIVVGTAMALFQSNAGGAWDNAKKAFEKGITLDGKIVEKGSTAHAATVVGDTVGDPLKDTAGPAMNILIKLTIIVSLIIAPFLAV